MGRVGYLFPFCDSALFFSPVGIHIVLKFILMSLPAECLDTNSY